MEIEICCFSLESVQTACQFPIQRIELCTGFSEGGTTPSQGLLEGALEIADIPVYVMLRPRGGDFCYNEFEKNTIRKELKYLLQLKPAGIVFGALLSNGELDRTFCQEIIDKAQGTPITFHRAFDQCANKSKSLDLLIDLGFKRILSSGGAPIAPQGIDILQALKKQAGSAIAIMAGSGVMPEHWDLLKDAGMDAIHTTAKKWVKSSSSITLPMNLSSLPDCLGRFEASPEVLALFTQNISLR